MRVSCHLFTRDFDTGYWTEFNSNLPIVGQERIQIKIKGGKSYDLNYYIYKIDSRNSRKDQTYLINAFY